MKKIAMVLTALALCGCVDMGRVGMHPKVKTAYLNAHRHVGTDCLYQVAYRQHLSMEKDDPLPGGTERYNLLDKNYETVAWLDASPFGKKQTSVDFYYGPDEPEIERSIEAMISQCKNPF
ncbi:hypothetical protein [Erwinia persicina]